MPNFCVLYHRYGEQRHLCIDSVIADDASEAEQIVIAVFGDAEPIAAFEADQLRLLAKQAEEMTDRGYLRWLEGVRGLMPPRRAEIQAVIDRHREGAQKRSDEI